MKKMLSLIFGFFIVLQCSLLWAADARPLDHSADYTAINNLRDKATEALNTANFDELAPLLDKNFTIITLDNHKFTDTAAFKAYWEGLFTSKDTKLQSIEVRPTPDAVTQFLAPNIGILYGTSIDTYKFINGKSRTIDTRWSAVVHKDTNGWKVVSIHLSADIFQNPILTAAIWSNYWFGGAGLLLGFILGLFVTWCNSSRKP